MSQTAPETQPPANQPAAPARPDGISEEEWTALGDPGKQAIVRERTARAEAERQLAAARARPTPPPGTPTPPPTAAPPAVTQPPATPPAAGGQPDFGALIQQAVTAAVQPLQQRLESYETQTAAQRVHDAITTAAGDRFHDPADAFSHLDLTGITDPTTGQPDTTKITAALDKLLTDKPYLAKPVDGRRFAVQPQGGAGVGPTPGGATPPIGDRVNDVLARMQKTTGLKLGATDGAGK